MAPVQAAACNYVPTDFLICAGTPFVIRVIARSFELPLRGKSEDRRSLRRVQMRSQCPQIVGRAGRWPAGTTA